MLLFSQRNELEMQYKMWIEENRRKNVAIEDCTVNVINFLYSKGFLNEEKIFEYLKK